MNHRTRQGRQLFFFIIAAMLLFISFCMNISKGSVEIPLRDVLYALGGSDTVSHVSANIVMNIRLPRSLAAMLCGALIASAGLLLQVFFDNPIVEPYVLGVSSGSTLFVGLALLGGYTFGMKSISPFGLITGAFLGAMLVMGVVIFAAKKVKSITTLLIIGMMAGFICGAITSVLSIFADRERIAGFYMWSMGSFSGFTWQQVQMLYTIGVPFLVAAFLLSKPMNSMLLGENYAQSMGVKIRTFRMLLVLIASVLTALVTAFAGPVSFIGLAIPHIVRLLFRSQDTRIVLPAVCICGALMAECCDYGVRMLIPPAELPLSSMTSLIGAPLVVFLLVKQKDSL